MADEIATDSEVGDTGGRLTHWLLLGGNRMAVAVLLVAVVVVVLYGGTQLGVVAIGPSSSAATAFGSGLISGTVTLVTIALSINQLILSRVFGSPSGLSQKLQGTRDLREQVRGHAGEPAAPNDPAAFLDLLATTLRARAENLRELAADGGQPAAVLDYADDIAGYGGSIAGSVEEQTPI